MKKKQKFSDTSANFTAELGRFKEGKLAVNELFKCISEATFGTVLSCYFV